ncbi:cytochrome c peroxidase [Aliarcobacter faecis]|uniref:cytochrome-c peroxidase n=1 Tax=Aliarcobacter faecis TaxID=1564138 RepID=UPI00047DECA6|nr:cytochrome-c peroxidase [Aliarcobacter faecis]QKF73581.1 cytochrome c peroxidase [Aliarcobacter faecis]
MKRIIFLFSFILGFLNAIEVITPIPLNVNIDVKKADLGKELFFDVRLSKDDTISCHSCHLLNQGGVDNKKLSVGVEGKLSIINTPTVFNSSFSFTQFWNGRSKTLHEQVFGPISDPNEMAMSFEELEIKLRKTDYLKKFFSIYKDGITINNIADAIVEYEKTLITPNSPFDKYLRGDETAISDKAKRGYQIFKEQGCIACHHGRNVGGNLYAKFGVVSEVETKSKGRFEVTKNEEDLYYFKVPSLRNIELTYPYLHDGRFETLEDTVKFMANYQLGKSLNKEQISDIISFLVSLTGELYNYEQKKQ